MNNLPTMADNNPGLTTDHLAPWVVTAFTIICFGLLIALAVKQARGKR